MALLLCSACTSSHHLESVRKSTVEGGDIFWQGQSMSVKMFLLFSRGIDELQGREEGREIRSAAALWCLLFAWASFQIMFHFDALE